MSDKESKVLVDRATLLEVLRTLNVVVVSLDRIGTCASDHNLADVAEMTVNFLRDWQMFSRLSEARSKLSAYFSQELGDDDMDELEREMANLEYWRYDARFPRK